DRTRESRRLADDRIDAFLVSDVGDDSERHSAIPSDLTHRFVEFLFLSCDKRQPRARVEETKGQGLTQAPTCTRDENRFSTDLIHLDLLGSTSLARPPWLDLLGSTSFVPHRCYPHRC